MDSNKQLPAWKDIQKAKREVSKKIKKDFKGDERAVWLVSCAIVKPAALAVIYSSAAMNELKEVEWRELV